MSWVTLCNPIFVGSDAGYAFVGLYTSREQKYTHNNARMAGVASRNPDCKL